MNGSYNNTHTALCASLIMLALSCCTDSSSPEPTGASLPDIKPGTASITYVTPDRTITFRQARAVLIETLEGQSELRLFLSETSLDNVVLTDFFGNDEIREWVFPPGAKRSDVFPILMDLRLDFDAPDSGYQGTLYPNTPLSTSGKSAFDDLTVTENRVTGTLNMQDLFEGQMPDSAWTARGSFEAPLTRIKQTTPLTGDRIAESPQARHLTRVMDAMSSGDLDALKPLVTADAFEKLQSMIKMMTSEEVALQYIKDMASSTDELNVQYQNGNAQLFVAGKRALLQITETRESMTTTQKYRFQWQDGQWLMD